MEEKEPYSFVRETIKGKPVNKKKLFRRTVITVTSAVLFGLIACVTFLLLEPVINNWLNPEEITKVKFPETEEEVSPEQLLTEQTVEEEEAAAQKQTEEVAKEAVKQAVENEVITPEITLDSYQEIYDKLYNLATKSETFMTTVTGVSEGQDWFQGTVENENMTSGVILADNSVEILVLADMNDLKDAKSYNVSFCNGEVASANLKMKDKQTGLGILAVRHEKLSSAAFEQITTATLGSSNESNVVGRPVIGIGAPYGTIGSIAYGVVTSNRQSLYMTDAAYKILNTDIDSGTDSSGVIINLQGEITGIISSDAVSASTTGTIAAYGITEIKGLIEKLSNEEARAYIGIKGMDVTTDAHNDLGVPYGAYVTEVEAQSPAMLAGILNGDVITQIGDHSISSINEYRTVVMSLKPEVTLSIHVMRYDGEKYNEIKLEITTGEV